MRLAAALSVVCLALGAEVFAQGQLESGNAVPPEPVVLADELEPWVSSEYWAAALCRETLGQLINEHRAFANPTGLANAQKLMDLLRDRKPRSLEICALLHKQIATELHHPTKFIGFDAPHEFLVGYGLDHAEDFRHVPYVASLQ